MLIEYITCDICGKRIDFEKGDKASARFEIAKIKTTLENGNIVSPLSPFASSKLGDLSSKETVEKISIDMCGKCSTKVEEYCTSLKETKNSKNGKQANTDE